MNAANIRRILWGSPTQMPAHKSPAYIWRVTCSECGGVDYYAPCIPHNADAHYGGCNAVKFGIRQKKSILINSDEAKQAIANNQVVGLK